MLEIFLLIHLGKRLGAKARRRGWAGWPWVVLLVLGWFGGLFAGMLVSAVAYQATHPGQKEPPLLLLVGSAYGVAAFVAVGLFVVVGLLPADEDDDFEDEDEPPRRGSPQPADPYAEHDRRYTDDADEQRGRRR